MRFEIEMDKDSPCWVRYFDVCELMDKKPHFFCGAYDGEERPCLGRLEDRPDWCPLKEVKDVDPEVK